MALIDRIREHLASGGVVVVQTTYRATVYRAKHAGLFSAPTSITDNGIYVTRGKRRDYVFPQYVRFGRYVQKGA